MAGISTNRFGANSGASYWKQLQAQREKSKAYRENFAAMNAATSSTLASASAEQITASGDLAAKAALKRIREATTAKLAKNQAEAAKNRPVFQNKPPPTEVSAGKMSVNFGSNMLTLSDGTVIDIKTGIKKVSVTV